VPCHADGRTRSLTAPRRLATVPTVGGTVGLVVIHEYVPVREPSMSKVDPCGVC